MVKIKLFFIWRDQYSLWCSTGFCPWSNTFSLYTYPLYHSATLVIIFMLMTLKYTLTWHHPVFHLIFLILRTVYRIFRSGWLVSNLNLIQEKQNLFYLVLKPCLIKLNIAFLLIYWDINFYQSNGSVASAYFLMPHFHIKVIFPLFANQVFLLCANCINRKYLTISTATTVANALVSCRFDYCNSLFTGISTADFTRLKCIQNSLALLFDLNINMIISHLLSNLYTGSLSGITVILKY
jgi:hypothetical protein